ncbi:DUF2790 domain-containing protein [Pseudomonas sp. 5P_3.1_Bac2]|uniref:DUF2790 domain-containing protein n=1 Tax=Pseudomonas sp. 5P_3.1_Bac2 TaxID=2971617 RepID=UPI0021CA24C9|nr:DUF2790 domain-containing protein [Pseudomonas sp. 5P_3.1_Bac2]MCU1717376.1 DUF2790 domain-containing protein [Pseudomonas sp. 5P_3.1_Bac2]
MRALRLLPSALLFVIAAVSASPSTSATLQDFPSAQAAQIEKEAQAAAQRYADKVGKATPQTEDYRYGMPLNIAKVVFITPKPQFCGVVPKIMVFEDTSDTLRSVRYRSQGLCRNQR